MLFSKWLIKNDMKATANAMLERGIEVEAHSKFVFNSIVSALNGNKARIIKIVGSGKWERYVDYGKEIHDGIVAMLPVMGAGYDESDIVFGNDAPRGGKWGNHFFIPKIKGSY